MEKAGAPGARFGDCDLSSESVEQMKRMTRRIGALVERAAGPLEGRGLARPGGLTVIGYHRIDDTGGHLSVGVEHFKSHLDWIDESGFDVVDLTTAGLVQEGARPAVAITFDDGYLSVAESAWPELKARGWPAVLYVVPGYLDGDRAFPWDTSTRGSHAELVDRSRVRELARDGMTIGSHSLTHRYLPGLSTADARAEILDSRRALEDLLGQEVVTFSYPMGGWNASLRDLVAEAGYATAVTVTRGRNHPDGDPLALRRPVVESDPADFVRTMKGYYDWLRPFDRWRETRRQARSHEGLPANHAGL